MNKRKPSSSKAGSPRRSSTTNVVTLKRFSVTLETGGRMIVLAHTGEYAFDKASKAASLLYGEQVKALAWMEAGTEDGADVW